VTPRRLLVAALGTGLLTAFLVYNFVRAAVLHRPSDTEVAPPMERVVLAKEMVRPKTVLTAAMLTEAEVPVQAVHREAARQIDEVVGRMTKETIHQEEQVLFSRLYAEDERPGLTFVIPPGKRAVTVAVNEVIGVAGFIKPGDRVDVLGTFDQDGSGASSGDTVTSVVLQDVEVLAISQRMEDEDTYARVVTTVTLALTLAEAGKVTLAEERGKLRLVLRPADMKGQEYAPPVTADDLKKTGSGQTLSNLVPAKKTTSGVAVPTASGSAAASGGAEGTGGAGGAGGAGDGSNAGGADATAGADKELWTVEVYRGTARQIVHIEE